MWIEDKMCLRVWCVVLFLFFFFVFFLLDSVFWGVFFVCLFLFAFFCFVFIITVNSMPCPIRVGLCWVSLYGHRLNIVK